MKQIFLLLLTTIIMSISVFGFSGFGSIGARSGAMGRASVSLTDFWSIQNNPAGMALQQHIGLGVAFENRFLMKELSLKSAALVVPIQFGVLGLSYNQFGYNLYNENKVGLAYARSFGSLLRIGLQLDYLASRFAEGYEGKDNVTFELGVQSSITDKMTIGAYVFNPIKVRFSDVTDEKISVVMRFGFSYLFTEKLIGIAEIEKQFDFNPDLRLGIEYKMNETFYARTGVALNPGLFTFGAGMQFSNLRFDLAASMHQVLGSSMQASLIYQFGQSER
ncbi:MAG: hypothetical protein CVT92_04690 [Bacteroidetes bacterium HGW-Bacteroidetes-1]|jgi:hypothetical protein|nr:MAG: hypothetical protein CVT92_04690 [Bacteroidetes bacterium HGW-Bacteroidetes-1]